MDPLPAPNELLARIAEATFGTVGLNFVGAAGGLIGAGWGTRALFVSELDNEHTDSGRVLLLPAGELRRAGLPVWIPAHGVPWFLAPTDTRSSGNLAGGDALLERLEAKSYVTIRLESRSTSRSEYLGVIDASAWEAERASAVEALLRLIAGRTAAELERERFAQSATARDRAVRYIADHLKEGVVIWAGAGRTIEYINGSAEDLLGESAADLRADASGMLARLESLPRAGATRDAEYTGELAVAHPQGMLTNLRARVMCISAPDGTETYFGLLSPIGDIERELVTAGTSVGAPAGVVENRRSGLIVADRGEITLVSDHVAELLGHHGGDELAATRLVMHTDDKGDVSMTLRECLRQLERHRHAERVVRVHGKNGGERFIDLRSQTLTAAGAKRLIVNVFESTSRERRLMELTHRDELHESVLRRLPIRMLALDAQGTVTWMNAHFSRELAVSAPELQWTKEVGIGDDYIATCERAAATGVALARDLAVGVASVLRGPAERYATEFSLTRDGEQEAERTFLAFATRMDDKSGALVGLLETTPMMRRVRDAQGDAARAWGLLANLPEQVARLAPNGDLVQVIGPANRAPGVALLPSGAFKRNVREILPPEEAAQLLDAAREAKQRNQPVIASIRVISGDAERRYEARLLPLEDDLLLTLLDRTAEEHAKTQREPDNVSPRLRRRNPYDLTFREASVLELMAEGASDKEIAARLGVSVFTVNKHVSKVLHKMGAASRTEASMRAVRESLVNR